MRLTNAVCRLVDTDVFVEPTVHPFAFVKPLETLVIFGHNYFGQRRQIYKITKPQHPSPFGFGIPLSALLIHEGDRIRDTAT